MGGGGFLTIGYCSRTICYCFPIVFWKFLSGGQGLDDGGGQSRDEKGPPLGKTINCNVISFVYIY